MLSKIKFFIYLFLFFVSAQNIFPQFGNQKELLTISPFLSFEKVHAGIKIKFALKVNLDTTWHINSNKPNEDFLIPTEIILDSAAGMKLTDLVYPIAKELKFDFSEIPLSVYEGEFFITGFIHVPKDISVGEYYIPFTFHYQACNNVTCLAPEEIIDTLKISVVDFDTPISEINQDLFAKIEFEKMNEAKEKTGDDSVTSLLDESGFFLVLLLVFLGGLALNLTPCVYPLIPITVGYFGGQSEGSTKRLALMGGLYVLGLAVTYSIIGVITSLSGAIFGALLQNTYVIISIAIIFLLLSLSMFGLYEFKLPDSFVNKVGAAKSGLFGALFMGITMGVVAAPCIGPFVIGLVTYVAAKGDPFYGFILFFVLALGLGLPYFVLALFSGKIKKLPKAGEWMVAVKHIFGIILIGMAVYFVAPLLPKPYSTYALPVYVLLGALYLLFFEKNGNNVRGFKIFRYVFSVIVLAIGIYSIVPTQKNSIDWKPFDNAQFLEAKNSGLPIIIDFYADWCIPCKELDALTFSDATVIEESKRFIGFKADMTKTLSEEVETLRKEFKVIGVPTVLIIDSNGIERERITGFVNAETFLAKLKSVK